MLNEFDEDNLNDQPVLGQFTCAKCGLHYDLRGVKCYQYWLNHGSIDKKCKHCGGNM